MRSTPYLIEGFEINYFDWDTERETHSLRILHKIMLLAIKILLISVGIASQLASTVKADGVNSQNLLSTQNCAIEYFHNDYSQIFDCTNVILNECQKDTRITSCIYRNRASWIRIIEISMEDFCALENSENLCTQLIKNSNSWEHTSKEFCLILADTYPVGALRNIEYASCLLDQTIVRALNVNNILQVIRSQ